MPHATAFETWASSFEYPFQFIEAFSSLMASDNVIPPSPGCRGNVPAAKATDVSGLTPELKPVFESWFDDHAHPFCDSPGCSYEIQIDKSELRQLLDIADNAADFMELIRIFRVLKSEYHQRWKSNRRSVTPDLPRLEDILPSTTEISNSGLKDS